MAVNRIYSLDQTQQRPAHRTGPSGRRASRATTRTPWRRCSAAATCPATRPARRSRSSRMLAALDAGMPLSTAFNAPPVLRTNYLTGEPARAATTGARATRAADDRQAEHVDRLRQVGQHVLRPAGADARRREGGPDGRAARPELAHRHRQAHGLAGEGQRLGLVHPRRRRHHAAGDGQRLRDPGRRRRVLRAAPGPVDHRPERQVPIAAADNRNATRPSRPEVARGAADAARCVTGYGAAGGGCGGWSTAPGVYGAVGRPVGGKTGTTDDTRSAWFVGFTPELAAAASSPTRTTRSTSSATATPGSPSRRSPGSCAMGWPGFRHGSSTHPRRPPSAPALHSCWVIVVRGDRPPATAAGDRSRPGTEVDLGPRRLDRGAPGAQRPERRGKATHQRPEIRASEGERRRQ